MAKENETVADIIAELRHKDTARRRFTLTDEYGGYEIITIDRANTMLSLADRIEAAWGRETAAHKKEFETRDAVIQTEVAAREAEREAHKRETEAVGNAAKLLEAVKAVVDVGYPHNFQKEAPHIRGYCYDITRAIEKCFAALAAPARICDVLGEEAMINIVKSEIGKHVLMATDHERKIAEMGATAALATAYATVSIKESEAAK